MEEDVFPDLSHLSAECQCEFLTVMPKKLFSTKPGYTQLIQHKIRLRSPNQMPIRDTTSKAPEKFISVLKQEVEYMLDTGIIEHSRGEWCSPVVLVPKKNDT